MSCSFNRQIFVDKLAKLNASQQSIETLSHWCIFHRNNAKELVETWESELYCSPFDRRIPFLFLANDILQNSRRKGLEFVNEYWKVLPRVLNYVHENGDEDGRKAVLRLVDIWEDRKVFGSRGQVLKEELLGRNLEKKNREGKLNSNKLSQTSGDILQKLISSYEQVCGGFVVEDVLFGKCQTSISYLERVQKEIGSNPDFGKLSRSGILEELQGHQGILEECIDKLKAAELSRTTLLGHLREATLEQEVKIEQVHHYVQAAHSKYELVNIIYQKLQDRKTSQVPDRSMKETAPFKNVVPSFIPETTASSGGQAISTSCIQLRPTIDIATQSDEERKSAAAAMAAKLTSSTDSARMLSYVLSSLASEGVISNFAKEDLSSSSEGKRPRIDSGTVSPYIPEPLPSPFARSDAMHHQGLPLQQPLLLQPPLQLQPPMRPLPVPEYMQSSGGSAMNMPYNYASQNPAVMTSYPMTMVPPGAANSFIPANNFPVPDGSGGNFNQTPESAAMSLIPQQ